MSKTAQGQEMPAGQRGGAKRKRRSASRWERHRSIIVANALVTVLLVSIVLAVGFRVTGLFVRSSNDAVAEHLLRPIEEKGWRPQLAYDLPKIVSVPKEVSRAIHGAARTVGVDAVYLTAVAARESGFDPSAHAAGSTAAGLYQFTANTWLRVVKVFGDKYGLAEYARQIAVAPDGQVSLPDAAARAALLQLRNDPYLSALMAAELGRDNKARLERMLGRTVTPAEIYITHFLGLSGGAQMIEAARSSPQTAGASLLPAAAGRNSGVFGSADHAAAAGDIVARIDAYFDSQMPRLARM
jgi:Transglycosylase SLT domain